MGIDVKDKKKNGDEAKTGKYTGGKGDYEIVCNEPTQGAEDGGKTAMENCLAKNQGHQRRLHDQRAGRRRCLRRPGAGRVAEGVLIVSVDGGCDRASSRSRTASSARPRSSTR